MTIEQIDKFLTNNDYDRHPVKVNFKSRDGFTGIFVKANDYDELKSKNFWRIVNQTNVPKYQSTKDNSLSRIFNGTEITKLTSVQSSNS